MSHALSEHRGDAQIPAAPGGGVVGHHHNLTYSIFNLPSNTYYF
jgi:hypothetical protein